MRFSPSAIIHREFLNRFTMYHINHLFIIQLYSQLRKGVVMKGGVNLHCQQLKGKKMPVHWLKGYVFLRNEANAKNLCFLLAVSLLYNEL